MRWLITPLCLLVLLVPLAARAGVSPEAKILIHLVPADENQKPSCQDIGVSSYKDLVARGELYPQVYFAYVLVAGFDVEQGVAGVQFGISYDDSAEVGVDIDAWHKCSQLQWHLEDWPSANTGNLLTWAQGTNCQTTEPVVVGYFVLTAHSPDRLKIIPRPVDSLACVAACQMTQLNSEDRVDKVKTENLGWADFGGGPGYNPWDPQQNLLQLQKKFKPIKN